LNASGEAVNSAEPRTDETAKGEVKEGLPGSKSVARMEGDARNEGGLEHPCRTNCEGQAGTKAQRQEAPTEAPGVGWVHRTRPQSQSSEAREGTPRARQPAPATSPVRTTEQDWQTFLRAIAEKAYTQKHYRFGGLYRMINQDVLRLSFYRLRKDAASGVDPVTFQDYERNLEENLTDLAGRLRRKAYRARLGRRKYIPKGKGKLRPLGIPVLEDKLLQTAATQILLARYEVDFLPGSFGYRPGIRAHAAVKTLPDERQFGAHNFVVEADITGFFDHLRWQWLERKLEQRIAEGAFLNLIRKWLRAGILAEDGRVIHPQTGTPQGGGVWPVRAKFGLEVAPDKTQTRRFGRKGGPHNGRFDFLGFEFYWGPDRKGKPRVKRRPATKKHLGALPRMRDWIREDRHQKPSRTLKTLKAKLQGTWNY
jgi:RNA-directed DNA polymerase